MSSLPPLPPRAVHCAHVCTHHPAANRAATATGCSSKKRACRPAATPSLCRSSSTSRLAKHSPARRRSRSSSTGHRLAGRSPSAQARAPSVLRTATQQTRRNIASGPHSLCLGPTRGRTKTLPSNTSWLPRLKSFLGRLSSRRVHSSSSRRKNSFERSKVLPCSEGTGSPVS